MSANQNPQGHGACACEPDSAALPDEPTATCLNCGLTRRGPETYRTRPITEAELERDEIRACFDDFMREAGEALLGPPEEGTQWGGGGILAGIEKLKAEREGMRVLLRAIKEGPDRIAGCACYHLAGFALGDK